MKHLQWWSNLLSSKRKTTPKMKEVIRALEADVSDLKESKKVRRRIYQIKSFGQFVL